MPNNLQRAAVYSCSTNVASFHSPALYPPLHYLSFVDQCLASQALEVFLAFFLQLNMPSMWLIAQCSFIDCINSQLIHLQGCLTKDCRQSGLNSRNWLSHCSRGQTSETKVAGGLVPCEGSLPGLQMAVFSPYHRMAFSQFVERKRTDSPYLFM